jgi:diguanylate cyclase (GGDEF)-like protein
MRIPLQSTLARGNFLHQLVMTFTVGIICLALLSSLAISTLSTETVRAKLIEQGRQATETLAAQSTLALLYSSSANAEEPVRATLAFPDVRGVSIYDLDRKPLLTRGDAAEPPSGGQIWPAELQMEQESDDAWYFVAPVYAHRDSDEENSPFVANPKKAELIGFVRVVMGKETLKTMAANILNTNMLVSVAFATIFLLFLLAITKRLTTPLKHLADIMRRATSGEKKMRASVRGPKDIIDMEIAFNTMMEVLETRELQLEKARDAALESARIKGEFAANVSHELRTPLNAVLGMLELLHDMGLTPKQREYISIARNAGESLLKLIEDILNFSRIDAGKIKSQPADFELHEILHEVVGLLAGQAHRKDLALGLDIADDVPPNLKGEPARIRQVLVNLAGNAIKFTERGSVEIKVKVEQSAEHKIVLRFEVADTGIGIPPEAQRRIFDAFIQVDGSSTRSYDGAGLGLAISRQLVEFMGGEIGVESDLGRGSTFWFTVPLEKASEMPLRPKSQRSDIVGLRFLIVDDNEINRRFLQQILSSWEICHDNTDNGQQALEMLRTARDQGKPYDFVILDKAGPYSDASRLLRQIGEEQSLNTVKVILVTNQLYDEEQAYPANVVGYITKPVHSSILHDCIVSANQKHEHANETPLKKDAAVYLGSRILVVEDNRASQQVAVGMLERLGCRLGIAATGRDALELVARGSYDLVLMDCHMPQMDGYEATRQIRALEAGSGHIPIIAMTANAQQGDSERCLAAGMDDYLTKPLKLSLLREKLTFWLAPRKAGSEPVKTDDGTVLRQPLLNDEKLLDRTVLNELRREIGDAFPRMIEVFLEDMPGYLQSIKDAIIDDNAQALAESAHAVKGGCRNLGANRIVALSRQLEDLGRRGTTAGADEFLAMLNVEFERVKKALRQEIRPDIERRLVEEESKSLILVADDDRAVRFALCDVLQKDGYRIEQAGTGTQALAICERHMPDLVLMDAMMPEMDGFTVCSRIRELAEGLNTPILIITALDDEHSIELAFSAGATDYISKPVHFAVLRQRVARMLDVSRVEKHVNRLAYQDNLTGLPNRALFMERLDTTLNQARLEPQVHAVLFLDLDRFKLTNDSMGHEVGDLLLKAAAERIQGCVRAGDLVARFGGDEFTLLLENIGAPEIAATTAEKICASISKPFGFMGREFYLSSSIGISVYPDDGNDSGMLIKHADTAMFRAKERGNTYRFYEDSMEKAVSSKLRLENDLRHALEHNEFFLHYQPQVDLRTGKITGLEALVRWNHPEFGLIPPGKFIPVAEETGLIDQIGEWVLRQACVENKAWQATGLMRIPVAINLSARQLEAESLAHTVLKILRETGLSPEFLELELTESAVMKEPEKTRRTLRQLKEAGILISIDDFGTGYSNLNQLKHFSFDKLKIDQSFIRDIMSDSDDAAIVLTIIAIARSLKLKVIAEGVETEEQLHYLQDNGCDEMQGYLFSKPVPSHEAALFLREDRRPSTIDNGRWTMGNSSQADGAAGGYLF